MPQHRRRHRLGHGLVPAGDAGGQVRAQAHTDLQVRGRGGGRGQGTVRRPVGSHLHTCTGGLWEPGAVGAASAAGSSAVEGARAGARRALRHRLHPLAPAPSPAARCAACSPTRASRATWWCSRTTRCSRSSACPCTPTPWWCWTTRRSTASPSSACTSPTPPSRRRVRGRGGCCGMWAARRRARGVGVRGACAQQRLVFRSRERGRRMISAVVCLVVVRADQLAGGHRHGGVHHHPPLPRCGKATSAAGWPS